VPADSLAIGSIGVFELPYQNQDGDDRGWLGRAPRLDGGLDKMAANSEGPASQRAAVGIIRDHIWWTTQPMEDTGGAQLCSR